jgi:hypothetical protein
MVVIVEGEQAHTAVPRTKIVGYARQRRLFATPTCEGTHEALNVASNKTTKATKVARVVLVAGFESFNRQLYQQAAASLDNIDLTVFSDSDFPNACRTRTQSNLYKCRPTGRYLYWILDFRL